MKHFRSIDGLRAWLAWTVVFAHIALYTGVDAQSPLLLALDIAASDAVRIFIIISGFVITHLLIEKKEGYLRYITRRFLRIYPVYFICLTIGIGTSYLYFETFAAHPWGEIVLQPEFMAAQVASLQGNGFIRHLLAHYTLMQGVFSNRILNLSEYTFLGPAWSLSLEWQFYIVAPLILFGLHRRDGKIIGSILTVAAYVAFKHGWFGDFIDPSFLPGAGLYFAMGIATRLVFEKLPRLAVYPLVAVIIAMGFVTLAHAMSPFVFWMAFVAWLKLHQPADAVSIGINRWLNRAFNSAPAQFLGARSYSTYLIHEPIIHLIMYVCIHDFALGMWQTASFALILTPALTLLSSVFLYRYVEAPAIAYGKTLFRNIPDALDLGAAPPAPAHRPLRR